MYGGDPNLLPTHYLPRKPQQHVMRRLLNGRKTQATAILARAGICACVWWGELSRNRGRLRRARQCTYGTARHLIGWQHRERSPAPASESALNSSKLASSFIVASVPAGTLSHHHPQSVFASCSRLTLQVLIGPAGLLLIFNQQVFVENSW